jgi:hypothetical protein
MKTLFAMLVVVHGLVHTMGFVKAFGLARVEGLKQPIGRSFGILWLAAATAFLAAAVFLFAAPRFFWIAGATAIVLSQTAIFASWSDAKYGSLANLVVVVPVALLLFDLRGSSCRSIYRREAERRLTESAPTVLVTETDLAPLPAPVQTYLRRVGVVGRPHVHDFRARLRGQMRFRPDGRWMEIRAEQHEFFGNDPARLFYIRSSHFGIPFEGLHLYVGSTATMQIRVASLVDVVDARGPEMNRGETVTLFNDMCVLAPASLIDANTTWEEVDGQRVVAHFTNAGNTVAAELSFDPEGDLAGFVSNDRFQSADGKTYRSFPWSTPVGGYRDFGGLRLPARGQAIWRQPGGDFEYARFVVESIDYNVGAGSSARPLALL